jgi:CspA family cold shock protein
METILYLGTGTVSWFNEAKGYGFIQPEDGAPDVFFHQRDIGGVLRTLIEGQKVRYNVVRGPRGLEARDIEVL